MQLDDMIEAITPEIYQRLATAVELGKWPDGVALSAAQRENCLQMVMMWQARHNEQADHMTIGRDGEIVIKSKQQLKQQFDDAATAIIALKPSR